MREEKEIRGMLNNMIENDEFHTIILKDVKISEIDTAKDVLKWVLNEK